MCSVQWHWYGIDKHALLFHNGTEFMFATPISRKRAELLVDAGMDSGS
jgi:hypothetical protein